MLIERAGERLGQIRLSFDIDNTCIGTYARTVHLYNWVHGTNHRFEDVKTNWELARWFEEDTTLEDGRAAATNFYNSRQVMVEADPTAGAMVVLSWLKRLQIKPLFISARPATATGFTYEWYGYWTPWIDRNSFLLQTDGVDINPEHKVQKINSKGIEWHFEDVAEDALDILSRTKAGVVMVNQPWNLDFSYAGSRLIRSQDPRSMSNLAYAFLELTRRLV